MLGQKAKSSHYDDSLRATNRTRYVLSSKQVHILLFQNNDPSKVMTGPEESLQSHLLCFLAERARKENRVVSVKDECHEQL